VTRGSAVRAARPVADHAQERWFAADSIQTTPRSAIGIAEDLAAEDDPDRDQPRLEPGASVRVVRSATTIFGHTAASDRGGIQG
jgi:hypothetical protein